MPLTMRMAAPEEILAQAGGGPDVPEEQVARMAGLISALGFRSPVVVDARGRIVQGLVRVLAARRLGLAAIPVRPLEDSGTGAPARKRNGARDPRAGCLGVLGHTVWRPAVFSRHEAAWVACRGWRADLAAFRAAALGLRFEQVFEDRLVAGGSSHPRGSARLAPLVLRERPAGPVLLVDDVATSGAHVEQALGALRSGGAAAVALVWISGEVR